METQIRCRIGTQLEERVLRVAFKGEGLGNMIPLISFRNRNITWSSASLKRVEAKVLSN